MISKELEQSLLFLVVKHAALKIACSRRLDSGAQHKERRAKKRRGDWGERRKERMWTFQSKSLFRPHRDLQQRVNMTANYCRCFFRLSKKNGVMGLNDSYVRGMYSFAVVLQSVLRPVFLETRFFRAICALFFGGFSRKTVVLCKSLEVICLVRLLFYFDT